MIVFDGKFDELIDQKVKKAHLPLDMLGLACSAKNPISPLVSLLDSPSSPTVEPRELAALLGVPYDVVVAADCDAELSKEQVVRCCGLLAMGLLARMRNDIRMENLEGEDAMEDPLAVIHSWAQCPN